MCTERRHHAETSDQMKNQKNGVQLMRFSFVDLCLQFTGKHIGFEHADTWFHILLLWLQYKLSAMLQGQQRKTDARAAVVSIRLVQEGFVLVLSLIY